MSSPYIISNWVQGEQFYGRAALSQELLTSADRCICLIGTRRVGKTSLLRRLAAAEPTALYCDLMQAAGPDGLDEARLVRLLRRELRRRLLEVPALQSSSAIWDREAAQLCPWLEEVSWVWEEHGLRITLLWDEAELLRRLPTATLMCLRAVMQHSQSLRLLICGSKGLAALNDRWRDEGSPFLFGFRTCYLAALTDAESDALIGQRGRVNVSGTVSAALRAASGNHPFLLQSLCDRVYAHGALRPPAAADLLVDAAQADLFRIDVAQLSPGEQAVLTACARAGSSDLVALERASGLTPTQLASFVHGLTSLGYLRVTDQGWQTGSELLRRWLLDSGPPAPAVTDLASLELVDPELQRLTLERAAQQGTPRDLAAGLDQIQHEVEALEARLLARLQTIGAGVEPATPAAAPLAEPLSARELHVLRLIVAGLRNSEIARELTVSENTVKAHVKQIFRKLGASDRLQAVSHARARQIIPR